MAQPSSRLAKLRPIHFALAFVVILAISYFIKLPYMPFMRRCLFSMFCLLLTWQHGPLAWSKIQSFLQVGGYYAKVTTAFLFVCVFIKLLPGAYFPPFFPGIPGWVLKVKAEKDLQLSGLKLIADNGQEVWYTNGITSPHNFFLRPISQYKKQDEKLKQVLAWYFYLYQRQYPLLKQGIFPSQKYLGPWAYPGHNTYTMLNFKDVPPQSVHTIQMLTDRYDRKTLKFKDRKIKFSYDVRTGVLER